MPPMPSVEDCASLLHKCKQERSTIQALRLFACMLERGLHVHPSVGGNHLLSLMVGMGSMGPAHLLFDCLPHQDETSWNLVITGYAKCGHSKKLLSLYRTMPKDQPIRICGSALVALLKACTKLKDLDTGSVLHTDIASMSMHEKDVFVGSTLVNMYAKCGSVAKAEEVFDKLLVRNIVSWNALMTAYVQHALDMKVLECFEQMQWDDIFPDSVTFICTLKACASVEAASKGQELHTEISRRGLDRELLVGCSLIDMYVKCGLLAEAQKVFNDIPHCDVILWTALITGYTDSDESEEAVNCYHRMQSEGISPNVITYACALKACSCMSTIDGGQEIHSAMAKRGLVEREVLVGNALMDFYVKCRLLAEAQAVFDKLVERDHVSWNTLITGYVEQGHSEDALEYFMHMENEGICPDAATFVCILKACGNLGCTHKGHTVHAEITRKGIDMELFVGSVLIDLYAQCGSLIEAQCALENLPSADVVAWTTLIAAYTEHGLGEEALSCFVRMLCARFSPAAVTLVCVLKACGSLGARDKGYEIHAEIVRKGWEREVFVGSCLVDMYAKCGSFVEAQAVFDKVPARNQVSWTALIAGYAQLGETENVFYFLDIMATEGIKPNVVTHFNVLNACSRAGLLDIGQRYFETIINVHGYIPAFELYTCMLDLLCRGSQIDKAGMMIKQMPFHPRSVAWQMEMELCGARTMGFGGISDAS